MDTRTPSTSAHGVISPRRVTGGPLRTALLASTALALAMMLPAAGPVRAQDATWQTNPGSGDFFDANNWTPGSVPTGTATFGTSNQTTLTLNTAGTFDGWIFNAGASNYTFTVGEFQSFLGAGIVINGGSATIINNNTVQFAFNSTAGSATIVNNGLLRFMDTSTAGSAIITNHGDLQFRNTSTAGSANITNNGALTFQNTSTAGSAIITNNSILQFSETSTAGNANIINTATLSFIGASTAGNAGITNNGLLLFRETSTAGSATIINSSTLNFFDTSTAGSAAITNNSSLDFIGASTAGSASFTNIGLLQFNDTSTAGSASFNNFSALLFNGTSTAGSATFTNIGALLFNGTSTADSASFSNSGDLTFLDSSTAGNANINNINSNSRLQFFDTSTAGSATITNSGLLRFFNTSTAGSATITNGGLLQFQNTSTAGNATLINNAGGTVDFSFSTGLNGDGRLSAGSIAGAGNYILGANELTVGSNNLSTEASGVISGTGSLVKTGTGTLTLTGANTYTGGTTINGGTLQLGTANAVGSVQGAITVGNGATFDLVNAVTSGITTILNDWRTYFRNSTSAGSANIVNNNGLDFIGTSTAGSATITNSGVQRFFDTSTAGGATITNSGFLQFQNTSTAGNAAITNNSNSFLQFSGTSTAGNATIANNNLLEFYDASTAGSATITNTSSSSLQFFGTSTAGNATIDNNGLLKFYDTSTAGSATITNNGALQFFDASTAGSATITNDGTLTFQNTSTADSATITNNSLLRFFNTSTAGSATITNNSALQFFDTSTAGSTAITNNTGGTVDFSNSTGANSDNRLSAGSIAGAGNYILGANELTIGSNNLSTEVSGVISGTGSLVKTGTGTLTLTGANTYSGGTTIAGGTLQFGNGVSGGITNLSGSINVTGGTLAIQAPTILNVAQTVTFGDNTALSIAAGASSPGFTANSITIGNGVTFNISGITDASQLDMVLIDTASGISGDFASISVGGFSGTVDYLTVSTRKSADNLQYLASYGLTWNAGNNLADGTFTLTNATDSFTVGTVLADQAANLATDWNGTALTKAGAGTLILTGTNTYTGGTTISGGTLSVSRDANLGAATGGLTFAGGTLSTTASFDTARAVSLTQAGRFDVAAGTELRLTGLVSGSGDLIKQGSGTLRLGNSANSYGNTLVTGGTLIGNAGSISGNIGNAGAVVFDQGGNASFAGDIAALNGASGGVVKRGAGALTLTGVSSLDWTIEAGALISSAERFGGNAAIASGAFFTFDQTANAAYAGILSGNGGFNKTGAALLNLSGDSSGFAGTTTVAGGTLAVNGSLGGMLDVLTAGSLQGTGIVGSTTIASGGALAPGNSIGTLTVNGNLTFNAGSFYTVEVSPTAADRTNVTGTATLTGATVQAIALPGSFTAKTYTILNAAGGLTGTFAGLDVTGSFSSARNPHLTYDANNVFLVLDPGAIQLSAGASGNQSAVASGINKAVESGATPPAAFDALLNMSGAQLTHALNQVSGQPATGGATSGTQMTTSFLTLLLNPFGGAPNGNPATLGYARSFGAGDKPLSPDVANAYAAVTPKDSGHRTFDQRWSLWGQGYGGASRTGGDATLGTNNTTTQAFGFAAGADYRVAPNTLVGFALAGGGMSWGLSQGLGGGKSDVFQIGGYGSHSFGPAYVSAALSYAWHDMSTDRTVTIAGADKLAADFDAHSIGGRIETGYRFASPWLGITPYAALQVQTFRTPSYSERATSGSNAFALSYDARSTTATRTELGAWFDNTIVLDRGNALALRTRAAWAHDHSSNQAMGAVFQTLPGSNFIVNGAQAAPNSLLTSLGAELRLANSWSLGARFDGEFASGSQTYAGTGTVRYAW